jgi:hypothetical protein
MLTYLFCYFFLVIELLLRIVYRTYTYFYDFHSYKIKCFSKPCNWRETYTITTSWLSGIEILNILELLLFSIDILLNIFAIIGWASFVSKI